NSNDEDNEDNHSAEEEQNTKNSDSVKTPPVKKRGRPKKIVRANENKSSSVKRRGRPRKSKDESKKQTIEKIDWCSYIITCLKESKQKLVNPATHHYTGPLTFMILLYLHYTKFDDFDVTSQIPAIKHWKSVQMKYREKLEIEKYGRFGMLLKQEALNLQSELNKFREKFEENTTGIDNDDTTENENYDLQSIKNKEHNEDVHHILNEDDKVDDSCPATGVCSVIERNEVKFTEFEDVEKEKQQIGNEDDRVVDDSVTTIPDSVKEGKRVKFIENDNVLVDDVHNKMIKCSFEEIVQDSVERSAEVAVDSQHTIEDIFKQDEQIQSAEDVGCSILDLNDAKLDVYNGLNLRSPYEYLPVGVKKDLIFESQSGLGLNHLEMETLTLTLMVSAYVIDVWAELLNILEIYKDESLPLRYFFKITVYISVYYIGKDTDDEKLAVFIKKMKESFNENEKLMSLQNFETVFFLDFHEDHIYLTCVDFNKGSIHLIDNSANGTYHKNQKYKGRPQAIRKVFVQYLYYVKHQKAGAIEKAKIKRMKMSWKTTRNSTDCGVFTMLHMESYIGGVEGEWKCGLAKESKKQNEQLNSLRSKFAAKIILSEFNLLREKFMKLVHGQKNEEERKKTIDDAIANRDHREKI
nr:hypothetical protein [Tanacetum cinerariifolium]